MKKPLSQYILFLCALFIINNVKANHPDSVYLFAYSVNDGRSGLTLARSIDEKNRYIIYRRFTRPWGIEMGRSAGFHREVCIDRLTFDDRGNIVQVSHTLIGIDRAPLQ